MCRFRSAVAVYQSESEVALKLLPGEDSHTKIREAFNIRDGLGAAASRQTPVEFVPFGALDDLDAYEFIFDAGKPNWWTDAHTDSAVQQFRREVRGLLAEKTIEYDDDLYLNSVTTLPEGVSLEAGGEVYLAEHGWVTAARAREILQA